MWWAERAAPEKLETAAALPLTPRSRQIELDDLERADDEPAGTRVLRLHPDRYYRCDPAALPWPSPFRPYQRDGISALLDRDALLLADDMGLGKTVQTAAALRVLFRRREVATALVVVPAGLVPQWRRALREWAPELRTSIVQGAVAERAAQWRAPVHVWLTSYDSLRSDFTPNPHSPPRRIVWDVVVLDEAQRIKNRDTDVSRICKQLPRRRAWALTGTPLENRLDELASLCEFLEPWKDGQATPRLEVGPSLVERHRTLQLRRKKATVAADLPEKTVVDVPMELTERQRRTYDRAEREGVVHLKSLGVDLRIEHVLELITRLKQICNICPQTDESAKLLDLEARLDVLAAEGHKALVFTQYADDRYGAKAIARRVARFRPVLLTGELSSEERDRAVSAFKRQAGAGVFVLTLQVGAHGLNLQDASYVFHFDRWWNPAVERQAEDRTHRIGQTLPVTVYRYVTEQTIEERIDAVLRSKQALFDRFIDDVSIDTTAGLTRDEMMQVLGMSPAGPGQAR